MWTDTFLCGLTTFTGLSAGKLSHFHPSSRVNFGPLANPVSHPLLAAEPVTLQFVSSDAVVWFSDVAEDRRVEDPAAAVSSVCYTVTEAAESLLYTEDRLQWIFKLQVQAEQGLTDLLETRSYVEVWFSTRF